MKINKNSWHYKLNDKLNGGYVNYNNLCSYFWGTIFAIFMLFIAAPFFTITGVLILLSPIIYFFNESYKLFNFAILGGILDIILLSILWHWYRKEYVLPKLPYREPSLVKKYIVAKKKKICPLVHYE